jgi:hypothetical protein
MNKPKTIVICVGNEKATVELVYETKKAILVRGKCSEAWIPRTAIEDDGNLKEWFVNRMTITHGFLFIAPIE